MGAVRKVEALRVRRYRVYSGYSLGFRVLGFRALGLGFSGLGFRVSGIRA